MGAATRNPLRHAPKASSRPVAMLESDRIWEKTLCQGVFKKRQVHRNPATIAHCFDPHTSFFIRSRSVHPGSRTGAHKLQTPTGAGVAALPWETYSGEEQ